MWGHAFGAGLKQDPRWASSGYSARIYGALVGVDNWVSPFFRLGIAGGWGHTGIDGRDDTTANETSVSSYMGLAYGAFKGSGWYLSGRGGFAWHNYDTTRVLNAGGLSDTAGASHNGRQYIGALELDCRCTPARRRSRRSPRSTTPISIRMGTPRRATAAWA